MKVKCETCKKMKEDTAFNFKEVNYFFRWTACDFGLDTSKCQDCINPNRWDIIKKWLQWN